MSNIKSTITPNSSINATINTSKSITAATVGVTNFNKTSVGLGNVDNESKATMFTSPTFTGVPLAPTAAAGTNTTQIATTEFVTTALQGGDSLAELNDVTLTSLTDNE